MFSDVSDHALAGDINCIAYYGVTLGMGDGTYAPDANVTAFEMRLFVQRAADRMGADGEAVLGGVMLSDPVTRLEMAQLMFGLVNDIDDNIRINTSDNQVQFWDDNTNEWVVPNDYFADAKAQVPIFESQVIGAAYELGIVFGRSANVSTADSVFGPSDPVTRAEMAAFIARTLDHSNLRPEGLAFQHNGANSMISYRDGDFEPVEDARIDVFSALYADDAFDPDDGECELRFVDDETPSDRTCEIDIGDQLTDDEGNIEFTPVSLGGDPISVTCGTGNFRFASASGSAGRSYWAWTGSIGDEVDEDTTLADLEIVDRPVGAAAPKYARVSGGLPTGDELAKMGETVTFTLQLYAEAGANGRDEMGLIDDVAAGPDRSRNPYHLKIEKYFVDANGTSDSDAETTNGNANDAATGGFPNAPGDWDFISLATANTATPTAATDAAGALFNTPMDTVVWPNGDGEYAITLTHSDLSAATDNTDVAVKFTLTPFLTGNDLIQANLLSDIVVNPNTFDASAARLGTFDRVTGYVIFSDDASDPHSATAETAQYRIIGGSRTGNSVTVSVLDQYGDGMRNVDISLTSNLDNADRTAGTDQVAYPEEVDITVQQTEDGNNNDTASETGGTDPTSAATSLTAAAIAAATATGGSDQTVTVAIRVDPTTPANVLSIPADDVQGTFRTRGNGAYRIGYNYINPNVAQTEMITPQSTRVVRLSVDTSGAITVPAGTATEPNPVRAAEVGDAKSVYWTKIGTSGSSAYGSGGALAFATHLVGDVPARTIVVHERDHANDTTTDEPAAYFYDEDDTFIIENVGATFEMFEEALSLSTVAGDACQVETVMWENYNLQRRTDSNARPGRVDRTIWEIELS